MQKNELLDDVGRAEREKAHEEYERDMELGEFAVEGQLQAKQDELLRRKEEKRRRRSEGIAAFLRDTADTRSAQSLAGEVNKRFKGEQYFTQTKSDTQPKFNKTHIPKTEQPAKGWDIRPDASPADIASQVMNELVPKGAVITPDKLNEFSNKVKRELARKRIHPDVDSRAGEVYAAVDDKLRSMQKESRTSV